MFCVSDDRRWFVMTITNQLKVLAKKLFDIMLMIAVNFHIISINRFYNLSMLLKRAFFYDLENKFVGNNLDAVAMVTED